MSRHSVADFDTRSSYLLDALAGEFISTWFKSTVTTVGRRIYSKKTPYMKTLFSLELVFVRVAFTFLALHFFPTVIEGKE